MAQPMDKLPPIADISSLPATTRAQVLDLLFEPSTALHTLSLPLTSADSTQTFPSYDDLIIAIGIQLTDLAESTSTSDTTWLEQILGAHPRLGEKKVDSKLSRMEQAAMAKASGGDSRTEEEILAEQDTLRDLNRAYEEKFPGLRYVVFVNGRSRPVIFEDMRRRIARGDIAAERKEAIKAMCDIASDRARKLM